METGNEALKKFSVDLQPVAAISPNPMPTEMKLFSVLGNQIGLILVDLACASVRFTVFG